MQIILLLLATFIATETSASSEATTSTRKRLVDELKGTFATSSTPLKSTSRTPVRTVSAVKPQTTVATSTYSAKPNRTQQAIEAHNNGGIQTVASGSTTSAFNSRSSRAPQSNEAPDNEVTQVAASASKRTRAVTDPQETLRLDISTLLSALSSSIAPETKTRIAHYFAASIAREEKQKKELDDFTSKLSACINQLAHIKELMSKQPIAYRAFRLSSGTHICCGKEVVFVLDLLNEVEAAVRSQKWGRIVNFGETTTPLEQPSDYVNEDSVAGSWVAFLDARLGELENTRSMENYMEKSAKNKQVQVILMNRIIQLRELCQLLRETALNKNIGPEYREVTEELFNPSTPDSEASTNSAKKRRI